MYYCYLSSPVGDLLLAGDARGIHCLGFPEDRMRRDPASDWIFNEQPFVEAARQLDDYFSGARTAFAVPLALSGTEFQIQVLKELRRIPYGETVSYADVARRIGRPRAVRAVGAANARNPLPIFVPCHRVIGSRGDLTGFGGGLATKAMLLRLEAEHSRFPSVLPEA